MKRMFRWDVHLVFTDKEGRRCPHKETIVAATRKEAKAIAVLNAETALPQYSVTAKDAYMIGAAKEEI